MSITLNQHLSSHPKVVETNNAMLLMGNYYTKHGLNPVSMIGDNFNGIGVGDNILNTKECMFLNTSVRQGLRHHNFGIHKDPYIGKRYYCIVNGHHSDVNNTYSYLCVMYEDGNDMTVIGTISTGNIDWYSIADIDETYIYAIGKHVNGTGSYIYRLNKFTFVFTSTVFYANPSARTIANLIYKDETYLYFIMRYVNSTWTLVRYNKSNDEVKSKSINSGSLSYVNNGATTNVAITDATLFPQYGIVIHENFYEEDGKIYFYMPQRSGNTVAGSGPANQNMIAFVFDPFTAWEDENIKVQILDVYNEHLTWLPLNGYNTYRFWVKDGFLYYAIYDESNAYATGIAIQGIHKFKILKNGYLEWVNVNRINQDKEIISMIFDDKYNRIIIGYYGSCDVMRYDPDIHEYVLTNKEITNVASIGFDSYNRIWVMQTDSSVHMYNLEDPQDVTLKFERVYYAYDGNDIETYVEFNAISYSNESAKGNYKLLLTGNAYFKDSLSKELTVEYGGGIIRYTVIVTGDKQISCKTIFLGRSGD